MGIEITKEEQSRFTRDRRALIEYLKAEHDSNHYIGALLGSALMSLAELNEKNICVRCDCGCGSSVYTDMKKFEKSAFDGARDGRFH